MHFTMDDEEFNLLADIIAKKVSALVGSAVKEEVVKEEPKKEVKEETKKEESGLSLEQVIKAVKDYTLKDKDGAKKLKPILQSLGVERLSLLPNDKLPEFVEGIRKVGVEI